MGFQLTSADYIDYIKLVAKKIAENKDYISRIDAATGDGDHWVNMNGGYEAIIREADSLAASTLSEIFKRIAKIFISVVAGSSGVLYGSAYLSAAKAAEGMDTLNLTSLCGVLESMSEAIMRRGNAKPGDKTMVDSIFPAVEAYKRGLAEGMDEASLLSAVKLAAAGGAESTKAMTAVKGRAYYQTDKGVGHIDPGAVTMAYQIETLADYILGKI